MQLFRCFEDFQKSEDLINLFLKIEIFGISARSKEILTKLRVLKTPLAFSEMKRTRSQLLSELNCTYVRYLQISQC